MGVMEEKLENENKMQFLKKPYTDRPEQKKKLEYVISIQPLLLCYTDFGSWIRCDKIAYAGSVHGYRKGE